ncbi:MAG: hypothetical protein SF162_11140 [bacterium]|nr:hypothetical protein [bacterium]
MTYFRVIWLILRWTARFVFRLVRWALLIGLVLFLVQYSVPPYGDDWTAVGVIVRDHQFDYVTWEVGALAAKTAQTVWGEHPFLSEADRSDRVRAYFADLQRARALESQIERAYAEADTPEAAKRAAAAWIAERDLLRADLAARQTLIEAILEGQVAAVLTELGFGIGGQLLPPMSMRFTQVPNLLIVSPRDEIRFDISINLDPLPVDTQAALEGQIDRARDVSSLIVPLGGIALYPAMILETTSIPFAVETFAHEWLHHYLFAFPLGLNYDFAGEARIINETTASIFGREVGPLVLRRYYPELAPAAATGVSTPEPLRNRLVRAWQRDEPPANPDGDPFDPGRALHNTRVRVDTLLAEGRVQAAEAYMEARRRLFVANGYPLRKLNQAYFAFFGGYQSDVRGAGGSDPIGPAVRALLERSESIHAWIITMRTITTREALLSQAEVIESG